MCPGTLRVAALITFQRTSATHPSSSLLKVVRKRTVLTQKMLAWRIVAGSLAPAEDSLCSSWFFEWTFSLLAPKILEVGLENHVNQEVQNTRSMKRLLNTDQSNSIMLGQYVKQLVQHRTSKRWKRIA